MNHDKRRCVVKPSFEVRSSPIHRERHQIRAAPTGGQFAYQGFCLYQIAACDNDIDVRTPCQAPDNPRTEISGAAQYQDFWFAAQAGLGEHTIEEIDEAGCQ